MTAFQLAWPAFAYSIQRRQRRQAHLRLRPHLPALRHLLDVARARRARAVDRRSSSTPHSTTSTARPRRCRSSASRPPPTPATRCSRSASAGCARRSSTGSSAARRRSSTSPLNIALIPRYGMMGAAVATLVAYVVLFVGMWLRSRRVYPVPYQWRRILTLAAVAGGLTVARARARTRSRSRSRSRSPIRSSCCRSASTCPAELHARSAGSRPS